MSARDAIFAAIRAHRPPGQHDLPLVPIFPVAEPEGRIATFGRNLKSMGGQLFEPDPGGDPLAPLRARLTTAEIVCSAAAEVSGNRNLAAVMKPQDLADIDVAIVRAAFGIAETGSVLFTEQELQVNALAYLAQHLVVLLDPDDIVSSTQEAYHRPEFHHAHYASFHSGPSATADIEGVLIHGAQGVRSLTVLLLPKEHGATASVS
ncbi:MAG TPA: LUD domain-containing protein [Aliidongia sp.]|nr:LUD domain-containing protein [Aliidongia sp.]